MNASQSGVKMKIFANGEDSFNRVNTVPSLLIVGEPSVSKKGVSTIPKGSRIDNCHYPKRGGSHNIKE